MLKTQSTHGRQRECQIDGQQARRFAARGNRDDHPRKKSDVDALAKGNLDLGRSERRRPPDLLPAGVMPSVATIPIPRAPAKINHSACRSAKRARLASQTIYNRNATLPRKRCLTKCSR